MKVKSIDVVNLLEEVLEDEAPVEWKQLGSDAHCALSLRAFEIKTLLVRL